MFNKLQSYPKFFGTPVLLLMLAAGFAAFFGISSSTWAGSLQSYAYGSSTPIHTFNFGAMLTDSGTPGAPVTYKFTDNITRPSGQYSDAFKIYAHDIIIDGTNPNSTDPNHPYYILDGGGTESEDIEIGANGFIFLESWIGNTGDADITIKNVEITGFWQGIYVGGNSVALAGPMTFDHLIIHDNGHPTWDSDIKYEGIWMAMARNSVIQYCKIYNNNIGSGICVNAGQYNTFQYNQLYDNFKLGIKTWNSEYYTTSKGNTVYGNEWGGIGHLSGAKYTTIDGNTIHNNRGKGISSGGAGFNDVINNIVYSETDSEDFETGISLYDGYGIWAGNGSTDTIAFHDNLSCGNTQQDINIKTGTNFEPGSPANDTCTSWAGFSDAGTTGGCLNACTTGFNAAFTAFPATGCAGDVSFTDRSTNYTGHTLSYLWNFGDGITSTEASPAHTYVGGDYTVTLTLTDPVDSLTKTATETLKLCPYAGDIEGEPTGGSLYDGDVDGMDYYTFYHMGCTGASPDPSCDLNGDSSVDAEDMKDLGRVGCTTCY